MRDPDITEKVEGTVLLQGRWTNRSSWMWAVPKTEGTARYAEPGWGLTPPQKDVWTCTGKRNLRVDDVLNQRVFLLPNDPTPLKIALGLILEKPRIILLIALSPDSGVASVDKENRAFPYGVRVPCSVTLTTAGALAPYHPVSA